MTYLEARLLRKQARLSQKLERIKEKLANRVLMAQSRHARWQRNPYLASVRGIISVVAFGGFWWLGCDRVNGLIDELFGESNAKPQQHPGAIVPAAQTFWTFGRRRRTGQSEIPLAK
jgi:hypothetical protein